MLFRIKNGKAAQALDANGHREICVRDGGPGPAAYFNPFSLKKGPYCLSTVWMCFCNQSLRKFMICMDNPNVPFSLTHGVIEVVDHPDKLLVLPVDFRNIDAQSVVPLN
jgi:hypothetical protein